jgi:hypothetical protein
MSMSPIRNPQLTTPSAASASRKTRRNFLRQSVRAALGLGLLCAADSLVFGQDLRKTPTTKDGYFAVPDETHASALAALKRSTFTRYNGDHFTAANDYGAPVLLNLFKIEDLRAQRDLFAKRRLAESEEAQLKEESFSLIFRGPLDERLRQRTYQMTHHALGKLELFLVPVGKDDGARYYEAVFNRTQR